MDKSAGKQIIEKVKNIILVVLVLFTILLLYFFWKDISFKDISLETFNIMEKSGSHKVLAASDVLYPSEITVTFDAGVTTSIVEQKSIFWSGSGEETAASANQTRGILQYFSEFCQENSIVVKEIDGKEYAAATAYRSIQAVFDYYIPFKEFCDGIGIKRAPGYENIDAMTELAYTEQMPDSVFVYDGSAKKYYKLTTEGVQSGFSQLLSMAEAEEYITYDPLHMILGEGLGNDALVPLVLSANLKKLSYGHEFYPVGDEDNGGKVETIAKSFFSSNFDFVRKIEEGNGAITYMYGYGEKILIAGVDGTFEYKEEAENAQVQTKYFAALERALKFTGMHGGFETIEGLALKPHLKNVSTPSDKKRGYRFSFDFDINGHEVYYENSYPLVVEVVGNQVTYFKRDFINFNPSKGIGADKEAFSIVNILTENYNDIYDILLKEGYLQSVGHRQDRFEPVAETINKVAYGYVRLPEKEGEKSAIVPAWIISSCESQVEIYFDLYEPELLGYSLR